MTLQMNKLAEAIAKIYGKIIAVIGGKGGSLKSTTTQNLAVALTAKGHKVLIIDFDPQKTVYLWWVLRDKNFIKRQAKLAQKLADLKKQKEESGKVYNPLVARNIAKQAEEYNRMRNLKVVSMNPANIDWKEIEAYKAEYDFVICDTSGHLEFIGTTKDIVKKSDMVLIPFNNSIDDFNVRMDVKETIKSCGSIAAKVYSLVIDMNEKQNAKGIGPKFLANVADTMPIAPVKLYKRSSWLDVKYSGLGVVEANKDKIAKQQFLDLADFVNNELTVAKAA
ncbi:AAA family ATPase [Pseudomonas sp. NY11226]|uniref:AAA family ATPase n=1 Tax=Pseudomonas sp. NY11226 TaxID=3400362 RepID=UPI003A87AE50